MTMREDEEEDDDDEEEEEEEKNNAYFQWCNSLKKLLHAIAWW